MPWPFRKPNLSPIEKLFGTPQSSQPPSKKWSHHPEKPLPAWIERVLIERRGYSPHAEYRMAGGVQIQATRYHALHKALSAREKGERPGSINEHVYSSLGTTEKAINSIKTDASIFSELNDLHQKGMKFRLFFDSRAKNASAEEFPDKPHRIDFICRVQQDQYGNAKIDDDSITELRVLMLRVIQCKQQDIKNPFPLSQFSAPNALIPLPHLLPGHTREPFPPYQDQDGVYNRQSSTTSLSSKS